MADINAVAEAFVKFYYQTFDSNRAGLSNLYRNESMLTFEGQPVQGMNAIVEKLNSLPFQKVAHQITSCDAQPSGPSGNIVVTVTGLLVVDDSPNPLMFCQTFQLIAEGASYWVYNDIFRLNFA
ncbi:hypothetical protein G6F46_006479 [Rhizopus delemar]|uniref:Nuclear transport factor 2 n=3 Tax=Rhizopus TaxID=4842 RepID=I1CA28_RHIO9|nr:hypothetical protein RO3G_10018 [Rhizopus delemar RA 99-880]KAG1046941.1 hypothetical protein G6F43_010594 [Rhizopus delemar]KAG1165465.1 hypothetical protein G6F36_013338 [Rhizopus arrhizus]KAG1450952.1 hypothetical protein G6F55_009428 [Rhizopus delemar]KAG1491746.1 hypothetical protein G6F54_009792 [Rhizopus delemar]|eukprot:EIE85308.1 hypothetical protein RO3G_10018 [Rhizopus delemar RA 99-880]